MDNQSRITDLYIHYNAIIRPLISEIEARFEDFPAPLFNEVRAFNDHIARYYTNQSASEIDKAQAHIIRITLDCFKYLNVNHDIKVKTFLKQTKNIDLTVLDNGTFYPKFRKLYSDSQTKVREAKKMESKGGNVDETLHAYEDAHNTYCQLEDIIDNLSSDIHWARFRFTIRNIGKSLLFILGAIISGLIGVVIGCPSLKTAILAIIS